MLRVNINEELSKFKDSVIEGFDALKSSFLAEVDSLKKRHLISCGNDVLGENSEHLIKQLQEDITFLREQLKDKDEIIHSFTIQLGKRDNVVECNNVNGHETSDKIHCCLLSNHKEVQQNTTHEELLLDTSIIVNETNNINVINSYLKDLCEERNLYLIDNTKKFRSHHLNKGKLHLKAKGSKLLNDTFIRQLSYVFN